MTARPADQSLGAYLTGLRVSAGLDVAVLARRVSLSVAQVLELEAGRDSLFYNRRIRLQAARKIILNLGGDLARLPMETPDAASAPPPPVAVEAVAAKRTSVKRAAPASAEPRRLPRLKGGVAVAMGSALLLALVWIGTHSNAPALRSQQPADVALAPEPPQASVSPPVDTRPEQSDPAPVAQTPAMEVAAVAQSPKPGVDQVSGPAGSDAPACAWRPGEVPVYQPAQARKPGDMVYVVSQVSQVLCVADATGKPQLQRLEAGQSQSFYGQPPWQVASSQLQQTQLYFQGWKVRLPAQAQDRIQLVELR